MGRTLPPVSTLRLTIHQPRLSSSKSHCQGCTVSNGVHCQQVLVWLQLNHTSQNCSWTCFVDPCLCRFQSCCLCCPCLCRHHHCCVLHHPCSPGKQGCLPPCSRRHHAAVRTWQLEQGQGNQPRSALRTALAHPWTSACRAQLYDNAVVRVASGARSDPLASVVRSTPLA